MYWCVILNWKYTWARFKYASDAYFLLSLPSRECGLKSDYSTADVSRLTSHSLHGSVDWNCLVVFDSADLCCHSLHGSVDWNRLVVDLFILPLRHSLHGSVDWNVAYSHYQTTYKVTPFTGVWIEIKVKSAKDTPRQSHSLHGSVDWNTSLHHMNINKTLVTPFTGVWIEIHESYFYTQNPMSLPSRECGLK